MASSISCVPTPPTSLCGAGSEPDLAPQEAQVERVRAARGALAARGGYFPQNAFETLVHLAPYARLDECLHGCRGQSDS